MILAQAAIGPFRSVNTAQTIEIDPQVTALVGMNEAGKTVVLKALEKSRDALAVESFNTTDDYPRKDLATYLKRHAETPDTVTALTYELAAGDVKAVNDRLGAVVLKTGAKLTVIHKYDNSRNIICPQGNPATVAKAFSQTFSAAAQAVIGDNAERPEDIPELLANAEITDDDKAKLAALTARIKQCKWDDFTRWETWKALEATVPPFLYFSDYDLLPGKTNLTDLREKVNQAKADPKLLRPSHRAVLALLRMADVGIDDFAGTIPYEQLKAKIEAVSINLTDQVMEFWRQNEDLEVEVDIKHDPADAVPFNNGPNLYLRIKNRRHRGVSTSFDQRSRGFIWFFSFLVWFDSVQHQLDPNKVLHQNLILLLDEPGLALHALAQADFLRYIDQLALEHQVLYTTHSPFMVHSDRMHQIRLIEDRERVGTVISDVGAASAGDARTIFPLQAALGWSVAQNLFINKRNLLVEGPSELLYLQLASGLVEAAGGTGLRPDVTIVPVGGLDKVVTFVALLGASDLELAVLHDYAGKPPQKLEDMVRQKLLSEKALFNVSQFRDLAKIGQNGPATDIEDLFDQSLYLAYFQTAYAKTLPQKVKFKEGDLPAGDRIVERLERLLADKGIKVRPSGGFNHYTVATQFSMAPPDLVTVGPETIERFKALFAAINAVFK
jgi:hypothetical protein